MAEDTKAVWQGVGESRQPNLPVRAIWFHGLLATGTVLLMGRRLMDPVLDGGLLNPDSYMRLVRLEAMLHGHQLADVVIRDGSGVGTLVPWSHLLDSLIVAMAVPLGLWLDAHTALRWAAAMVGPLGIGALGAAAAWAAAPFAARRWLWLAPVLLALSPSVAAYGLLGVAHHHVLLVVTAVMCGGCAARLICGAHPAGESRAAWGLGAWAGVGIWVSPEGMPFALIAFMGVWLAWLAQPSRFGLARQVHAVGLSFLLVIIAALAVDPPPAGYGSMEIDRLSLVYLVLALVVYCAGWCATEIERMQPTEIDRAILALGVAVLAASLWLCGFPEVVLGSAGLMDGDSARVFLGGILEMQPVNTAGDAVEYLLDGVIAAGALCWFALRSRSWLLGYGAVCAICMIGLGAEHVRFSAYAAALAAVLLPILATGCEELPAGRAATSALARSGLIAVFMLAPRADILPSPFAPALASEAPSPHCSVSHLGALLAPYAGQVVLAQPDDTPELLYRTEILTVGSFYHRNAAALLRARAAWRSAPALREPDAVRRTDAAAILFCPHTGRSSLIADLPANTLFDRLARGDVPPWLHQEATDPASGNVLYRIIQ
jgi:hypothetical protein